MKLRYSGFYQRQWSFVIHARAIGHQSALEVRSEEFGNFRDLLVATVWAIKIIRLFDLSSSYCKKALVSSDRTEFDPDLVEWVDLRDLVQNFQQESGSVLNRSSIQIGSLVGP